MDIKEIRARAEGELQKDLAALREKIRELKFKANFQEVKNTKEIASLRRDIARILTVLRQGK